MDSFSGDEYKCKENDSKQLKITGTVLIGRIPGVSGRF